MFLHHVVVVYRSLVNMDLSNTPIPHKQNMVPPMSREMDRWFA